MAFPWEAPGKKDPRVSVGLRETDGFDFADLGELNQGSEPGLRGTVIEEVRIGAYGMVVSAAQLRKSLGSERMDELDLAHFRLRHNRTSASLEPERVADINKAERWPAGTRKPALGGLAALKDALEIGAFENDEMMRHRSVSDARRGCPCGHASTLEIESLGQR